MPIKVDLHPALQKLDGLPLGCQRLTEEGYQVDIAAPSVKKLQFVVHDFIYREAGLYLARRHRIRRRRPGRVRGPCHPGRPGSGVHPE